MEMKPEINNKNKGKFFALYWGQEVYGWEDGSTTGFVSLNVNETEFLILKPLSSISDEDAEVIELQSEDYNEAGWWDENGYFYWWEYSDVDYLRSKGYALSWMGLSVEEMVEVGWIKLIEK